ncbi:helix-turn-helix domain-containing protein [Thioclava sp.]|uniref:helix-turn-helix domain-containing protein n=1 Tax=Thioclava sp. TaxID=1933450 RepID=UPI003AA85C47
MPELPLLRNRRRDLALTQAAVAKAAGISIPTLRKLEQSKGSIGSLSRALPCLQLRWSWFHDIDAGPDLARRRRIRGLSQRALAEKVGCSRPTIIALERDLTGRVETLLRVLPILGIRQALRPEAAARRPGLVPTTNDPARDLVITPPDLAARIIAHFADRMSGMC